MIRKILFSLSAVFLMMDISSAAAQGNDLAIPSGANFDKAEFRLWLPPGVATAEAVVVLVPGSNGDGRGMVEDSAWRVFATKRKLALVGCRFTDKAHEQSFIEEYIDVSRGSGQALLDALTSFAKSSGHAELAGAPLLLWGMSAGGEFNYEFATWKPERVAAFVVNKGGIYYSAMTPRATRNIPAILFVGGKDLAFRTQVIEGLFAVNRRGGALWALATEPSVGHVVGRSRDLSITFFGEVLPLRLAGSTAAADGSRTLAPLAELGGLIGDLKAMSYAPMGSGPAPSIPTAWLLGELTARAWRAMGLELPFDQP